MEGSTYTAATVVNGVSILLLQLQLLWLKERSSGVWGGRGVEAIGVIGIMSAAAAVLGREAIGKEVKAVMALLLLVRMWMMSVVVLMVVLFRGEKLRRCCCCLIKVIRWPGS